jgi:hypothetical protein
MNNLHGRYNFARFAPGLRGPQTTLSTTLLREAKWPSTWLFLSQGRSVANEIQSL